jgi:hypothetical protein
LSSLVNEEISKLRVIWMTDDIHDKLLRRARALK